MGKIKKLPLHEAQKIAAGEVVERPANVVKELVENAIDAHATKIAIYIEQGGHTLIRVVDNGDGMSADDAHACFEHHATSKIARVEDLHSISSFGFRGEALASISAVSAVQLKTKQEEMQAGTEIKRAPGSADEVQEISCPTGTDITIQDIFFNVPARKKFLKKPHTEWRHIVLLFHAFCYDYPAIHFSLHAENKLVHNCPPVKTLMERVQQLWETPLKQGAIPFIEQTNEHITVSGVISNQQHYRYDRNHIFFFVNNRWVRNQSISRALLKGYLNVIPPQRYPAAVINITLDPREVDVNIHPRKQEVQFLHPRRVEQLITRGTKESLEAHLSHHLKKPVQFAPAQPMDHAIPSASTFMDSAGAMSFDKLRMSADRQSTERAFSPEEDRRVRMSTEKQSTETQHNEIATGMLQNINVGNVSAHPDTTSPKASANRSANETTGLIDASTEKDLIQQTTIAKPTHGTIIGRLDNTYILLQDAEGLFIVDQHAAHERVLYERFKERFETPETIALLFPHIITLTEMECNLLLPHLDLLTNHGIQAEQFGINQLVVHATPVHLKNVSLDELIKEVIGIITEYKHLQHEEFFKKCNEKVHAQMACKAAVKAGDTLTHEQAEQLIADLYKTKNRFACPHGRPTGWLLSTHEIEKRFKRRL